MKGCWYGAFIVAVCTVQAALVPCLIPEYL